MTTRQSRGSRRAHPGLRLLALLAVLAWTAAPAAAQATGSIRGKVTSTGLRPLAGAQVSIPGSGLGGLTNSTGDFLLAGVPVGERTVRVQMIGFATTERVVLVGSDAPAMVEFTLAEQVMAMDELVVTGVVGQTQRRAVGNVVERIAAERLVETSPATSVNQLIAQRSPGVQLMGQSGTVGAGAPIHIRGVTSMELNAQPMIYIDGVRMDNRYDTGPTQRGGSRVSRLDDINLEDIESIEIIKGPAAATLYGTEASNGVIQIVTKRGVSGAPQFDMSVRLGTHWLPDPEGRVGWSYTGDPFAGTLDSINLYAQERDFGPWGDPFKYGNIQTVDLSLRGGSDRVRYYVGGGYTDQVGVISYNWEKNFSFRSNIDATISDKLNAQVSLAYVDRKYRAAQVTNPTDHFGNLVWGGPANLNTKWRGWLNAPPEGSEEVDARSGIGRTTGSVQLNFTPTEWMTNRLIVGLDVGETRTSVLYPRHPDGAAHWWAGLSLGSRSLIDENNTVFTLDYGSSASFDLPREVRSTTSVGFQAYRVQRSTLNASGQQFAAPVLTTVSSGAIRTGGEEFEENATVGVFIQQQFDWRNRVFLTGAVRADDNSAFGADYDAAIYPKLSGTWVMHEESFFDVPWVSQFRLRGAWGAAGQQPSTFAAVRLYSPVTGTGDQPGVAPDAIGNSALKPERSEELELGFDLGLLNDRLQIVYTRYDRVVKDAMAGRTLPPSEGFTGTQIVNIGQVSAWGNEISLNARVLEGDRLGWDFGVAFATMRNRIDDLGGQPGLGTGFSQNITGFSIADLYWRKVVSADFTSGTRGPVRNLMCDGGTGPSGREMGGTPVPCAQAPLVRWGRSQPTWTLNLSQNLTLWRNLQLSASVDATGGHVQLDATAPAAHTSYCTSRACRQQDDPIFMAYRAIGRNPLGMYDAGFAKLREVSATWTLPQAWVGAIGASRGSVSVAGRNLMMLWTAQEGWDTPRSGLITVPLGNGKVWDPETRGTGSLATGFQTVMPPLSTAVMTLRLSF